ncbi:uncharacterized protein EI90DRAFT_3012264 [Cantharellus anzutake]|uniref:uncharacterized protein n=1 Tax=Cantharellus anzutake TaxID=1750568 RepID=UPI00190367F2|nr:uncharacterized protein EI90DRAFT_3012264 [Cantharellus anzutake]KAF8340375.1 hypothetical protein EI90DRAFT_3012264 [Cantharellus anzutake]
MYRPLALRRFPRTSHIASNLSKPSIRHNSSSSSPANTAKNTASNALGAAQKILAGAKHLCERAGAQAGQFLGVSKEPLIYNFAVARELLKQVYIRESLVPPTTLSTYTGAYRTILERATSPGYWRSVLESGEWAKIGIYGLEAYFIFHIGEMIGRRGMLGYKIEAPKATHH